MKLIKQSRRNQRGAALVEYGLIVAGVALVAIVAVSVFGRKTAGMIGASAHAIPGTDAADNGPVGVGHLVQVTGGNGANITIDPNQVGQTTTGSSLGVNSDSWIVDPNN